ncbi:MAG: formylglycine-generating enzyme family protein [Sandaracinaceae bacterium]
MRRRTQLAWLSMVLAACAGAAPEPGPGEGHPDEAINAPVDREAPASEAAAPVASEPVVSEPTAPPSEFRTCPSEVPDGMACIPGARFVRGSDTSEENQRPAAEVAVSTFLLDTHEVNNANYRACVEAGPCRRLTHFPDYMSAEQPAVGMRWVDADAYCTFRGKRLPTEAEWERAAHGDLTGGAYWWGDDDSDPCARAIVRTAAGRGCGTGVTWAPGSRPPGPFGLYDMVGNVWEWVADHYSWCFAGCARECGDACLGRDPRGACGDPHAECPQALGHRTVRGGSWWYGIERATATSRRGIPGENPNPHRFGFRCAADLDSAGRSAIVAP